MPINPPTVWPFWKVAGGELFTTVRFLEHVEFVVFRHQTRGAGLRFFLLASELDVVLQLLVPR